VGAHTTRRGQAIDVSSAASRWLLRAAIMTALAAAALATAPAARADCNAPANAIVAENCQPGTPESIWDVPGSGSDSIRGFATDISINKGQTVQFKVDTTASSYRLDIYRMGYYGGDGARKWVDGLPHAGVQNQPQCETQSSTGLVDCGNWAVSASWAVPSNAVSGIYFAHLVRTDGTPGESHVFFVVRDDASHSDVYYQTSDTTWQAYNNYGGESLYSGGSDVAADRAVKVSYNRPFITRGVDGGQDWVFNAEYPMVRWLERNGYDVSYETGVDSDRLGSLIANHKVFMSSGHDEYWSGTQRANVEAARNAGVNLAFFSGNEIFWKTRWEDNHGTLVTYKETHANDKIDPQANTWTGSWMDPRPFNPEGGNPQNALSGTLFTVTQGTAAIEVPAEYGALRFWRNTSIASLPTGSTATLTADTLGYEWDSDVDNGSRPSGLFDLSSTTVAVPAVLQDYGSTYAPGTAAHSLTLYRAPSGALVFGAGTVQWAWGLDADHDRGSSPADPSMQQATVNLLADMHVQPATPTGVTAATASTDTVGPHSAITSPAPGTTFVAGTPVTIHGTAADAGGGRVAAVEVSVDGGSTWHPAVGRDSWSYDWTPSVSGQTTLMSRAVDDSGNLDSAGTGSTPPTVSPAGPTATHASASASRRGPRVRVTPRTVRATHAGTVSLRVSCPRSARSCRISLRLQRGRRVVASGTLTVSGGEARSVTLKLSRAARRDLARKRSLLVTAIAAARDKAGHRATTRTSIRLLAPRRR
jgi:hypothetical protein